MSAERVPPSQRAHLVVCSHGMWGKPSHTSYIAEQLEKAGCLVLNVRSNAGLGTYDGLETMAARLVEELREFLAKACDGSGRREPAVGSISFVGYSAGGLVNRVAVGLLHADGFFRSVAPRAFVTFATPHLGNDNAALLRRVLTSVCGSGCVRAVANVLGGPTVQQMFLVDGDGDAGAGGGAEGAAGGPCLLERLAAPRSEYAAGLSLFGLRAAYGNALRDHTVPFESACLRHRNPYEGAGAGAGAGRVPPGARDREFCDVVGADSAAVPWAQQEAELSTIEQRARRWPAEPWTMARLGRKLLTGLAVCCIVPLLVCWLPIATTVVLPGARLFALLTRGRRRQPAGTLPHAAAHAAHAAGAHAADAAEEQTTRALCAGAIVLQEAVAAEAMDDGSSASSSEPLVSEDGDGGGSGGSGISNDPAALHVCTAALGPKRARMLLQLLALGWVRVHVTVPGPHTHGIIVNRRRMRLERPGIDVVAHAVRMITAATAAAPAAAPSKL
jgi:hypothetical protein